MTLSIPTPLRRCRGAVLALAIALPIAATPALAGQSMPIEVTSASEMKRWKSDVSRELDRALLRSPGRTNVVPDSGVVKIAFELDENGRAENLTVISNSSDWSAAREAKHAVKRLRTLAEAPIANAGSARFQANIIFADDRAERDALALALAQSERTRLASGAAEEDVIVLGG